MALGFRLWPEGNWHECCVQHDYAYKDGGDEDLRKRADLQLMQCVVVKGRPFMATLMYVGVRLFGRFCWRYLV